MVAEAITRCDKATVYDNSGAKGPRIVAQMSDGFIVGAPAWPELDTAGTAITPADKLIRHAPRTCALGAIGEATAS